MADLNNLKKLYLEHLEIERGRSLKTIENYDHYLEKFLAFSKTDKPSQITEKMVEEHLDTAGMPDTLRIAWDSASAFNSFHFYDNIYSWLYFVFYCFKL